MTSIVLNERAYAERALSDLSMGDKPVETLGRVAKYYYSLGYKKTEIESLIEDFMLKCDPSINIVKWQSTIDRQVSCSDKYALVDIKSVDITNNEMNKIQAINGKLLQRLMFTMLCLAKYGNMINPNNNGWINRKDKEIFNLANIKVASIKKSLMINDLWSLGYIGYSKVVDNVNINVKTIDSDGEVVLSVTDFRNLGNQYMRFCGENFFECRCCGIISRETHGKQKYCQCCALEVNRKKTIERYSKQN